MRLLSFFLLIGCFFLSLMSCQTANSQPSREQQSLLASTPILTPAPAATVIVEPTPENVTVTIWGPLELSPQGKEKGAEILQQQISAFESVHSDIQIVYEPKAQTGPASLLNYIRSASAVAPAVLPDLIILRTTDFQEFTQTQLLFPLDGLIEESLVDDLYPFAMRDTTIDGSWLALPLTIEIEHGVTRRNQPQEPNTLAELLTEDAPIWLFAGQAHIQGEMSQALLLQLLALNEQLPLPSRLPPEDELITLLSTLQGAQQAGAIPLQVLSLSENKELYERLRTGQADLIQSNSRQYIKNAQESQNIIFAPLPTLTESKVTVIDGYLFAVTTDQAREQEASSRYLNWLLESSRWGEWSEATGGLPARRSALAQAISDEGYQKFLDERLEHGWLRPGGALFRDFAQIMQEQFRGVMLEQISPAEAVKTITETYAP